MSKIYWERNKNKCPTDTIVSNEQCNSEAIVIGRQFSDGLNEQERLKLFNIEHNAQVNIIEAIEVNSEKQEVDGNKVVNIFVPTRVSQLENDKNFINEITPEQVKTAIGGEVAFRSDFTITEEQWASFDWNFKEEIEEPEIPSEEIEENKEEI
jgi:hypothetical protein